MMYRHSTGWDLNATILRLCVREGERPSSATSEHRAYLERIVREEIAQDRDLVWC